MQNIRIIFLGSQHLKHAFEHFWSDHHHDFELVAASNNCSDLFPMLEQHMPQILLLESQGSWSQLSDLIEKTHILYPQIKVLLLITEVDVAQIRALINVGVKGCLIVDPSFDGVDNAIRLVNSGKLTLSAEITQALLLVH